MKNKPFLLLLLLLASFQVFAQDKGFRLGIRFAPNVSTNRVVDVSETDNISFTSNSAGLRFSGGLTGDFYFSKNYSFYTGLWYSVFRSGLKYEGTGPFAGEKGSSIYNIQYLQIPIAIKLFTNEVATDTKLYFVLGGTGGIKINEKETDWEVANSTSQGILVAKPSTGKAFGFGDVGLLLGAGLEYQMGESTTLFGGLSYNRGLLDVTSKKGPMVVNDKSASSYYKSSLSLISLEAGIKF